MSDAAVSNFEAESDQYAAVEGLIAGRIASLDGPIFTTGVGGEALWETYLNSIPADRRQTYVCHRCRTFVMRFGGLVTIDDDGGIHSAVWDVGGVPTFFVDLIANIKSAVERLRAVDGVYLSTGAWGTARTGQWSHLHGTPPHLYAGRATSAEQAMAEKREEFGMLQRGLHDFNRAVVEQALRVLRADALDRSEKTLGVADWLAALHAKIDGAKGAARHNLIWKAVATAPAGFCHVRSTMIATLLEDILAGMPFETIGRRWAAKMHPLRYQRPQAAPSEGTIRQAEALVEKLGVAASLNRRVATLADVQVKLWEPTAPPTASMKATGVFGHLREQGDALKSVILPTTNITWEKFRRTVMPDVYEMEIVCAGRGSYYGLLTAADAGSPAILQWDGLDGLPRNPVSWYFYHGGSLGGDWGLREGYNRVTAVFAAPHQWHAPDKVKHHNLNVHFAIAGAKDSRSPGLALFPEFLKSEYHGIRSVIEAHSKTMMVKTNVDGELANGLGFQGKRSHSVTVRVTTPGGVANYCIDRLD